jgi:RND superfamily putative drug exporter
VLRHRRVVLAVWVGLLVFGGYGASKLGALLSNQFSVPGSPSQVGLNLLHSRFHERSDGAFTLVARAQSGAAVNLAAVQAAAARGARVLTSGKAGPALRASPTVA